MRSYRLFPILTATGALALAGCSPSGDQTSGGNAEGGNAAAPTAQTGGSNTLTIKGSDTLLQLAQAWAEAFQKTHPDISVSVTGGGTSVGFTSLANGQADVADASRGIEEKETAMMKTKGITPVEHTVARDALSIIVHKDNPVKELSIEQLGDMYLGRTTNWSQVGGPNQPITLTSRDTSSGTYAYFKEHVLDKKEYSPRTLHLASNVAIAKQVGSDLGSIGYVGIGFITPDVKTVPIKKDAATPGVEPTIENVKNNSYPLSRPLFQYTNGEPTGNVKTWIDFVKGPEGQKIVEEKEFIPAGQS